MYRKMPIRVQLCRAGWGLLGLALLACAFDWCINQNFTISLLLSWQSLLTFAALICLMLITGLLMSLEPWKRWRRQLESQTPAHTVRLETNVRPNWGDMQIGLCVIMLLIVLVVNRFIFGPGMANIGTIFAETAPFWQFGLMYLVQAHRLARLERQRGGIYYWQSQPALEHTKAPVQLVQI